MRHQCYYRNCNLDNYRNRPFCRKHQHRIMRDVVNELRQIVDTYDIDPVEAVQQVEQSGGNILKMASKIGSVVSKHQDKISRGIGAIEEATSRAQALTDNASQMSSQLGSIRQQISSVTPAFDSNYSQNQLAVNSPLGSQGNFQSFGDYVCIKKAFIQDLRTLLFQLLASRDEV